MAIPAIVRLTLSPGSSVDIFASLTGTGSYEISFISGAWHLYSDSGLASANDALYLNGVGSIQTPMKLIWHSDTPLYLKNFQVNPASGFYILTPITSVGLSVNCS